MFDSRFALFRVARDVSNSYIIVSTVKTSDMGFETALIDLLCVIPVERYESHEAAEAGHNKWLEFAHTGGGKEVLKLGKWAEDEMVTLSGNCRQQLTARKSRKAG